MEWNHSVPSTALIASMVSWLDAVKQRQQQSEVLSSQPIHSRDLVHRMADLIHKDRFRIVVQPVIDLQTHAIVGGEVNSRLDHPEQGLLFPGKFLSAVEEAGLHSHFDHYIFWKTCALMQRLSRNGIGIQYLSCNFNRKTLSEKDITARLAEVADSFGIRREQLALEITEREQETDSGQFYGNIHQLKEAGFRIFVDDLGAGVTSLRDLWSYPVDVMKIDRALLPATDDEFGKNAYASLRNLVADLGIKVLCEGVETEAQHHFVLGVGCHYGQGFRFYHPMEEERFLCLMGEEN